MSSYNLEKKIAKKGSISSCAGVKFDIEKLKELCCYYDNEEVFWYLYDFGNNKDCNYLFVCASFDSPKIFAKLLKKKEFDSVKVLNDIKNNNSLKCLKILTSHVDDN